MEVHHSLGTSTDWIVMIVYFVAIMVFGSYFGKYNRTTTDFFFGLFLGALMTGNSLSFALDVTISDKFEN